MKAIVSPVFGHLEMLYDIPAINMHWWTGVIVFPLTKTYVTVELHGTPNGPTETQQHSFARLLSGYRTLIQSATNYDFESLALHSWELEKIVIFGNGHMDVQLKSEEQAYIIYADENALFLTPTEAEFY
jgi:hypothetical protein